MAVAELVRTQTKEREGLAYAVPVSDEQLHNSRIGENYAKLINSHSVEEVLNSNAFIPPMLEEPKVEPVYSAPSFQAVQFAAPQAPVQEPVFAQSARVSADLFRADSVYNQAARPVQVLPEQNIVSAPVVDVAEEEDEDLRPTATTIQYKSIEVDKTEVANAEITNTSKQTRFNISKKDKIVIAVVASIIIALFVLIIVNSAIISSLGAEISALESQLTTVTDTYDSVRGAVTGYQDNIVQIVEDFAHSNGMVK